ncbi:MAG: transketolase [Bacteroidota bacterium]
MQLTPQDEAFLYEKAKQIRIDIIDTLTTAGSGHTAGPLGMADIFTALYFYAANIDPKNPDDPERDRIILSNGHIIPVRYVAMAHRGFFPKSELKTLRKFGSRLQGHPERIILPGLETTSGPLGSGLGQAAGMAYAAKMDDKTHMAVYCLLSDGEMQAGNIWESAMFAAANKLHNLVGIIDRNNIQINGQTEEVMPLESLADKWRSFNWHVLEIDGHNMREIITALDHARAIQEKPIMIIAHTVPGKGIPSIEYDYHWHGKPPKKEEQAKFLKELRTLKGSISASHHE